MYLAKEVFETVIESAPLVSIDLIVEDLDGNVLLGLRNNKPAQGYWFVPGGRILKNEPMAEAFKRLTLNELGVSIAIDEAELLGPYQHFYQDSAVGSDISTHYVVLGYRVKVEELLQLPKEQHSQYKWFSKNELLESGSVHQHTKWYFN